MTENYPPASGISASACQLAADWPAGGFPGSIPAGQGETAPGTPRAEARMAAKPLLRRSADGNVISA